MLKKELKLRLYQEHLLNAAKAHNTLVVLPTGLGKTLIALGLTVLRLRENPKSVVVFMAPTKPLVEQHKALFEDYLDVPMLVATGKIPPRERVEAYKKARVVFCTPQTLENDILTSRFNLSLVSLLIVDEAHRASDGEYAYNFVAEQYAQKSRYGNVLALSASPGHSKEKIKTICKNLRLDRVEVRGEDDPTVKPYVQEKKITPLIVTLPKELNAIKAHLEKAATIMLSGLVELDVLERTSNVYKRDLIKLQAHLQSVVARGEPNTRVFEAIKLAAGAHKVLHALELVQVNGIKPLQAYFDKLKKQRERTKSSQLLFSIPDFTFAFTKAFDTTSEHPKYDVLKDLIKKQDMAHSRIIIFVSLRETARELVKQLNEIKGVHASVFVGQKEGMTQKKQQDILEKFKHGEYNVLCSTSIGEEGIHVSDADIGVFFEPVSSALRSVQRKGRVGRTAFGRVYVLMTKGCIDERYYWISRHREKKMIETLESFNGEDLHQYALSDFTA